jgi:hypothetical protein
VKYIKLVHSFLSGYKEIENVGDVISYQRKAFQSAFLLVRVYYAVVLFILVNQLNLWQRWLELKEISPLWPVAWVPLIGTPTGVNIIMSATLVAALLSLLFPERRAFRVFLFVSLLEYLAFKNSLGKIGHGSHVMLCISFILIFLPDGSQKQTEGSIIRRQLYLTTFGAAQALLMLFYSMSGLWKFVSGIDQLLGGQVHAFSPDALAHQIAFRLVKLNLSGILGDFFIEHSIAGWPMYLTAIYLELFAFVAAFRPSLHRFWGFGLILFHLGTSFTLGIGFPRNILFLALFFVCSPFAPSKTNWKTVIRDLPIIGYLTELANKIIKPAVYSSQQN